MKLKLASPERLVAEGVEAEDAATLEEERAVGVADARLLRARAAAALLPRIVQAGGTGEVNAWSSFRRAESRPAPRAGGQASEAA
jgi:hypothetical protein